MSGRSICSSYQSMAFTSFELEAACSAQGYKDKARPYCTIIRDQIFVDEASCIGCGKCVRWAESTFEIEASKYGRARVISQEGNTPDEVNIAIETCPVGKWPRPRRCS